MSEFIELLKTFKDVGGIGVALWIATAAVLARWLVPKFDKWFDKHFGLVDTLQHKLNKDENVVAVNQESHAATHQGLVHLADGLHAAAPDDKKQAVIPHVEAIKKAVAN